MGPHPPEGRYWRHELIFLAKRRKPLGLIVLQGLPVEVPLTILPGDTTNAEVLGLKQISIYRYYELLLKIHRDRNVEFGWCLYLNCTTQIGGDDKATLKIDPRNEGNVGRGNMTNELGAVFRLDADGLGRHRVCEDKGAPESCDIYYCAYTRL